MIGMSNIFFFKETTTISFIKTVFQMTQMMKNSFETCLDPIKSISFRALNSLVVVSLQKKDTY